MRSGVGMWGVKIERPAMKIWFSVRIVNSPGRSFLPNSIKVFNCVLNDDGAAVNTAIDWLPLC